MPNMTIQGDDAVARNLKNWGRKVEDNLLSEMEKFALDLENAAKDNRPWTDRTGNARRSITGSAAKEGKNYRAALAIGVEYGKYLELSHGGRFRIVRPTVDRGRQKFIAALRRVFK